MKKVSDFCDRLIRLHVLYDQKEFDVAEIDRELDEVCIKLWGFTSDDVDEDELPAEVQSQLDELWDAANASAGQKLALENGYDLMNGPKPLDNWWHFLLMILAEKHQLFQPQFIAAARLKAEAQRFHDGKESGVISGAD